MFERMRSHLAALVIMLLPITSCGDPGTSPGTPLAFEPSAGSLFAVGSGPDAIAVGDLGGDGVADLVVANSTSGDLSVLIGAGDGTFQNTPTLPIGQDPRSLVIGDLNADGHADVAVAVANFDNVTVLMGRGDGMFERPPPFVSGDFPLSIGLGPSKRGR